MATLVLQIPDESLVQKVKQACKMIVGVASVKLQRPVKEKKYDITKTANSAAAMYSIDYTKRFKKDLRRCQKRA